MIHAGTLRPASIPRESKTRLGTVLTLIDETIDFEAAPPYFAFTTWGARPSAWAAGEWRNTPRRVLAATPVVGHGQLDLAPGTWFGWLRLEHERGEGQVFELGRIHIT